nr:MULTISPECIES: hypothetical protein [Sorangium]
MRTGSSLRRRRTSPRWLSRLGSRCWAITIGAGNGARKVERSVQRASMPPAEQPTTTS